MSEQVFLDLPAKGVKVTNARFMVPGETYAMSGIVSVKTTTSSTSTKPEESTSFGELSFKALFIIGFTIFSAILSKIMFWIVTWFDGTWHFLLSLTAYGIDAFMVLALIGVTFFRSASALREDFESGSGKASTSKEPLKTQAGIVKVSNYTITLRTASGEVKALESTDGNFVSQVTQALNQAIIARG